GDGEAESGSVGAGTGARVGNIFGPRFRMKGGLGTASLEMGGGAVVGALMVVNCYGDVVDPVTGEIVAGARKPSKGLSFADTFQSMKTLIGKAASSAAMRNTVIGVVATNVKLTKEQANKVAQMAHNGLARAVRPAHTMLDGDTIFALSTGRKKGNVNLVGSYAAEAVARAILKAVQSATTLGDCISAADFKRLTDETDKQPAGHGTGE
nr:P1 family peptidase [Anaerolineae bacterium]